MRCLLDANGNDPAGRVSLETLNDQLESVPRVSANKFVQAQRDVLAKQFDVAEGKIVPRHEERVARAKQQFAAAMDEELARLTALKAVNPSVRDSELDSPAHPARGKAWPCSTRPPCASRRSASLVAG